MGDNKDIWQEIDREKLFTDDNPLVLVTIH